MRHGFFKTMTWLYLVLCDINVKKHFFFLLSTSLEVPKLYCHPPQPCQTSLSTPPLTLLFIWTFPCIRRSCPGFTGSLIGNHYSKLSHTTGIGLYLCCHMTQPWMRSSLRNYSIMLWGDLCEYPLIGSQKETHVQLFISNADDVLRVLHLCWHVSF